MTTKIIVLRESPRDSLIRDGGSVLAAWAMILPGWWIGSGVLSFIGGCLFLLVIGLRAAGVRKAMQRTPEEALTEVQAIIAAERGK
jgi:hypothetical protein